MVLPILLNDILPIFIVAGVGFVLARFLAVDVKTLSRVSFRALSPCLVFNLLVTSTVDGGQFGLMALFCVIVTATMGVIARIAAMSFDLDRQLLAGFLLVVMFSNGGNYGLPATLFAFGREALAHATAYFVTSAVLVYTVGVLVAERGNRTWRQALLGIAKVPAVYGVIAAAAVRAFGLAVPLAVMRPIGLLSDAAIPIMMLVLGMQLERAGSIEHRGAVAAAASLSLFVTPIVGFAAASLLGLTGPARQAAILQASMPAAVITTVLALEFGAAPSFVTGVVFVSTILSPVTLTALIAYLR
jgi:predicted permease